MWLNYVVKVAKLLITIRNVQVVHSSLLEH